MDEFNNCNLQTVTATDMNLHLSPSDLHRPCLPALLKKDFPSLAELQQSFGTAPKKTKAAVSDHFNNGCQTPKSLTI